MMAPTVEALAARNDGQGCAELFAVEAKGLKERKRFVHITR
jgi:hypothetical protein